MEVIDTSWITLRLRATPIQAVWLFDPKVSQGKSKLVAPAMMCLLNLRESKHLIG
jgi:hypothetical protein